MYNLPSREKCLAIAQEHPSFYRTCATIDGYEIEVYGYFGCINYETMKMLEAHEMRGITFVKNNGVWERNLSIRKFFNINEHAAISYDSLKDKKIKAVNPKEDGSLISFVKVGDNYYPKSKNSFKSEQVKLVQSIIGKEFFTKEEYFDFLLKNYTFPPFIDTHSYFFELVSPLNQVVVDYKETELRLIQIRDNQTGEYKLFRNTKEKDYSLQTLMQIASTSEDNIEGWVIHFEDSDEVVKLKTNYYVKLHKLVGDTLSPHDIIQMFVEGKQDDIYAFLKGEKLNLVREYEFLFNKIISTLSNECDSLINSYRESFNNDRKSFALVHARDRMFKYAIKYSSSSEDEYKSYIRESAVAEVGKKCSKLSDALVFLAEFQ